MEGQPRPIRRLVQWEVARRIKRIDRIERRGIRLNVMGIKRLPVEMDSLSPACSWHFWYGGRSIRISMI